MFNSELKEQYIHDSNFTEAREKFARQLFGALEKYEEQWGSDICTRSVDEIQLVVDAVSGYKKRSWATTLSYLHTYGRWCISNGVAGATDALLQIRVASTDKLRDQTIPNPAELQEYLNSIFEPENHRKIDNTFRCFYWLAYAGMREDDIYAVRSSDVDFVHMVVKFYDYEYPVYEEALPAMMNCVVLTAFSSTSSQCADDMIMPRGEGDILIRGTKPSASKWTLRPLLSRVSSKAVNDGNTRLKLSYNRVWLSGLFYRMYQRECSGFKASFASVALEYLQEKYKNDPDKIITKTEINQKSKMYLSDYKRWKKAFYD